MKIKLKHVIWIISILSFLGIIACYPYLPAQIPIHWNYKWEVDGVADKNKIFILGLMPFIMAIFLDLLPKFDPKRENYEKHARAYYKLKYVIVLLFICIDWITVLTALKPNIHMNLVLPIIMGILFIFIGNYLPKMKSNFFVGIKNPWTISDEVVWRKTHKAGGYLFVILGLLMIFMGILNNEIVDKIIVTLTIASLIGINIYSYIIYRNLKQ
jgi:uncharacterized membrane protein